MPTPPDGPIGDDLEGSRSDDDPPVAVDADVDTDADAHDRVYNVVGDHDGAAKVDTVPLGPACSVLAIFLLLIVSVGAVVISAFLLGSQSERAVAALRQQLIPWVEQSSLRERDRNQIVDELEALVIDLENDRLNSRQLTRLKVSLEDAPILQWGTVQRLNEATESSGLTEQEKAAVARESNRLLRMVMAGQLGMQKLEFLLQPVSTKNRLDGRLTLNEDVDDAAIQEFLLRATTTLDRFEVDEQPLEMTVPQVFRHLLDEARTIDDPTPPK